MKIRTVKQVSIDDFLNGKRPLEEIGCEIYKDGYFNYIPSNDETYNWMFGDANPYYKRRVERRLNMIEVLRLAKANGCEVFITPFESNYDYGFMIFHETMKMGRFSYPISDTIMYIQNGDFWGFDFSIEYIPSKETGTGCRCNEESICEIDWETLLEQKREGLEFANKLGAKMYHDANEFKTHHYGFDKMIQL